MKKIIIAFDIDGTLRCNCTETCRDTNERIVQLAIILNRMKNTTLVAWSGGGKQYAQAFVDSDERLRGIFGQKCFSKLEAKVLNPDIAIDDIQECTLGKVNLIVREK
jgi:hypothetical protein